MLDLFLLWCGGGVFAAVPLRLIYKGLHRDTPALSPLGIVVLALLCAAAGPLLWIVAAVGTLVWLCKIAAPRGWWTKPIGSSVSKHR